MPARELQERLNTCASNWTVTYRFEEELAALHEEARQIEAQLKLEEATPDNNLVDGVNLAIERFEAEHPDLTATLRSIANSVAQHGDSTPRRGALHPSAFPALTGEPAAGYPG